MNRMLRSAFHLSRRFANTIPIVSSKFSTAAAPEFITVDDVKSFTNLHKAAAAGRAFDAQALLDRGLSNMYERTIPQELNALHIAALNGHANIVSLLLHRGCDPFRECRIERAPTAFHLAVAAGQADAVKAFIANGCLPQQFAAKGSLIKLACFAPQRAPIILKYLLTAGADATETDEKGVNSLMHVEESLRSISSPQLQEVAMLLRVTTMGRGVVLQETAA